MQIRLTILLTIILLSTAFIACDALYEKPACQTCQPDDYLKSELSNKLGLQTYELLCSSCERGNGGFVNTTIMINETKFHVYYKKGMCSSSGYNCGFEMSFTSFDNESNPTFAQVKEHICNQLLDNQRYDGQVCNVEEYDNTENIRQRCLDGEFDTKTENTKTFSLTQKTSHCRNKVESFTLD